MFKYTINVYQIRGYSGSIKADILNADGEEVATTWGAGNAVHQWVGETLKHLHKEHREHIPFPVKEETLT